MKKKTDSQGMIFFFKNLRRIFEKELWTISIETPSDQNDRTLCLHSYRQKYLMKNLDFQMKLFRFRESILMSQISSKSAPVFLDSISDLRTNLKNIYNEFFGDHRKI